MKKYQVENKEMCLKIQEIRHLACVFEVRRKYCLVVVINLHKVSYSSRRISLRLQYYPFFILQKDLINFLKQKIAF